MSKVRQERLAGIIKKNVSEIIQFEVKEPMGFITITDVDLTADYSYAKIYFTVLGESYDDTLDALNRAKGFIRSRLSHLLDIRKCPDLIFAKDTSLEMGNRISSILNEINEKEKK